MITQLQFIIIIIIIIIIPSITVRLIFLAHSVRMRPTFQGLPWFECAGLAEDELLLRFLFVELLIWRICCDFIFSLWTLIWYNFLLHTINVARVALLRVVFTVH